MIDLKKVLFLYRQNSSFTQGAEQGEGVEERLVVESVGERMREVQMVGERGV